MEMDDSVRIFSDYLVDIASGRSKFVSATFVLVCEPLENHSRRNGLNEREFNKLVKSLASYEIETGRMNSTSIQRTVRLLIPTRRPNNKAVETLLVWFMTYWKKLPRNASKTIFMWFIGCLQNDLIQPDDINFCYDVFFQLFDVKSLSIQICKFLELMTTPKMITKFRTRQLMRNLQLLNQQGPILHLLSLYKTLRPDKVPMQIPVLTSGFGSSGEKDMMEQLAKVSARIELHDSNLGSYNFNSIKWILQQKKKAAKKDNIVPPISYIKTAIGATDGAKELLECETMKEVALSVLSAKAPAQILSLASSPEALFYMRFQDQAEVNDRFTYAVHKMLLKVETLIFNSLYETDIIEFLKYLKVKQEIDLDGTGVITKFVKRFCLYVQNPIFIPHVLNLAIRPSFTDAQDLNDDILIPIERMFYTATFEYKLLVIESLWKCISSLMVYLQGDGDAANWEPIETMKLITRLIEQMYNYCFATKGVAVGHMKHSAIFHYLDLCDMESQIFKSWKLFTCAPICLMLSCILTGPMWLVESCSALILKYKERIVALDSNDKQRFRGSIIALNDVWLAIFEIIHQEHTEQSIIPIVMRKDETPHFGSTKKPPILYNAALLPERLLTEQELGFEWSVEDLLEYCNNNYSTFAEVLNANRLHESQSQTQS